MELGVPLSRMVTFSAFIAIVVLFSPAYGQVSTPCSASMIASFTPCMNFVTNRSTNGTTPTSDCCNALKSLTSSSRDCLCLIVNGNVPLQLPINRTLAVSLPRACKLPGVPLQCKASGVPIPAPAPDSVSPGVSPAASPSVSPGVSPAVSPSVSPGVSPAASPKASSVPEPTSPAAATPDSNLTPPSSPTGGSQAPAATTGSRQALTPSAAMPSYSFSPFVLLLGSAFLFMKF